MADLHRSNLHCCSAIGLVALGLLNLSSGSLPQPSSADQIPPKWEAGLSSLEQTYYALAAKRTRHIARLHAYAAAGTFPRNTDFPGRLVPYFVDKTGTACAVGQLMRLDGQQDLVASIASSTNHIRIENVHGGPLLDWMRDSGLTQDECALIQPSYATIEDYRQGRQWKDEVTRLQQHFAKVEETLTAQSQRSLCKALIAKVDEQFARNPDDPALSISVLSNALRSDEPNVRIAAAHAMVQASKASREARLNALNDNLSDSEPTVRFWTAVAIENIGAASPRGKLELHRRTLPVFLDTFHKGPDELRLAALNQLANVAPETMGTNRQFRIMPEIRRALVKACGDENRDVRSVAQSVLNSWRWQRTVYESQRIPRHYLADSADLEALATETLALDREFAEQPRSIESLLAIRSIFDTAESITYLPPVATETKLPIAESAGEAKQIVDDYFKSTYSKYRNQTESPWPFWEIVSAETDRQGLYYVVEARRTDSQRPLKLIYILPRPSMLSAAGSLPYYWFDRVNSPVLDARVGRQRVIYKANEDANIVLGTIARNDVEAFAATCDVFAYFLTHHSQLFIDRKVQETPETLTWTGRLACIRKYNPRFFEQGGGGSSVYGGGGWELQRVSLACNRKTGKLSVSVEPIEYPTVQLPADVLTPDWATEELKLMGWKPLETLDYFGQRLFPPEYQEAIDAFDPNDASQSRQILYRRHTMEKALPRSEFMLGLLYDRAGQRDKAIEQMKGAAGRSESESDPGTLVDVARWELKIGQHADARKHAESALKIWPEHPEAAKSAKQLEGAKRDD